MLILPNIFYNIFAWPAQNSYLFGIIASLWLVLGFLSIFGYSDPEKYIPILLLQLFYQLVWMFGIFLVNAIINPNLEIWTIILAILMGIYIVGDLLVIPFRAFFEI